MTVQEAFEAFLRHHPNLRPASVRNYRNAIILLGDEWLNTPLREISRDAVEARHREIAAQVERRNETSGAVSANTAIRLLKWVYSDASDRDDSLPRNPVRLNKAQWFTTHRRTRHVPALDLARFWAGVRLLMPSHRIS